VFLADAIGGYPTVFIATLEYAMRDKKLCFLRITFNRLQTDKRMHT